MLFVRFLAWTIFSCVLMSFVEHQVHAKMMHKPFFLSSRFSAFKKVFLHHATLHHGTYAVQFADQPVPSGEDKGIRLSVLEGVTESLLFALPLAFVSVTGAISFVFVVALHHTIWNMIHLEMHKPEQRFFSQWPVYKYLARHHLMHHKYPSKNMNVVFPLADFVLGTNVSPRRSDLVEFHRAKLLRRQKISSIPQFD